MGRDPSISSVSMLTPKCEVLAVVAGTALWREPPSPPHLCDEIMPDRGGVMTYRVASASVLVTSWGTARVRGDRNILFTLDPPSHCAITGLCSGGLLPESSIFAEWISSALAFHSSLRLQTPPQGNDACYTRCVLNSSWLKRTFVFPCDGFAPIWATLR